MPSVTPTAADRLRPHLDQALGGELPLRVRLWDGSELGSGDGPLVVVRRRRALRRLVWQPGELGLAEAYIAGDIDVEGDVGQALRTVWAAVRQQKLRPARLSAADRVRAMAAAVRVGAIGPRPAPPGAPSRLSGRLHSKDRDRAAIHHHYDLSNDFYKLLLDETMAYSSGYWTSDAPDYTSADAQRDKLDMICTQVGLTPQARLLDIGCGWGSLTLHAAERYGARVTAVTLAAEQAAYVRQEVKSRGLSDLVDVQRRDYRDIDSGGYDAVATIEMGEHVGDAEYPAFAAALHDRVKPGGHVMVQQMARGRNAPGGGAFIETYIVSDMHMRPLGETVGLLEQAGLEVRSVTAMREHYVRTIDAWHRTLEDRWADFVALAGEETARVWRLYMVGSSLSFAENRMGVDQILSRRPASPDAADDGA
ncbi:SAM-dependent methyltransferase [Streptomyces sp. CBMA29]|uniref:SAM-dependent methyltransferase n=1 Tax=Streptomyces sp. CBMA29 TaxID=1896314 RepID=UPI00166200F1|nr:cyclopropane-fatty-acyl-phospholipid synthase family protein [Streptomyces sp. CBMA29]MBD0734968.1 cyclopropane-fatty-acyl-phospholipid synthase [Streptomyces sp. CBMA29]